MWQEWYQSALARREAMTWWQGGALDAAGLARAIGMAGPLADARQWRAFVRHVCAWLAAVLLAAAAVCAVAANWDALDKASRLTGAQAVLVVVTLTAMLPGLSALLRTLALLLACLLLGALLALVGQTYQSGADPWQLFAAWAGLMLPWVLAARSAVLWLVWAAVLNVALLLWMPWLGDVTAGALAVFALANLFLLGAWEAAWRRFAWLGGHAGPRLLASWLTAVLGGHAVLASIDAGDAPADWHVIGWWAGAAMAIAMFYRYVRRDLAMLALVLSSAIAVVTAQCAARIGELDDGGGAALFAMLALVVLAQAALAAGWLRRLARSQAQ